MHKVNNVKISMKDLDRFVNCKQQLYNKKNISLQINEHSGCNRKCKCNYNNKYVNVCKFINQKQRDNYVISNQGYNYIRLNTMSTMNSMNYIHYM